MLGNASPRKPNVAIASRSETDRILLVACRSSSASNQDVDLPGAGVDAVLDQLFYDRRGSLDDFTGSNLTGHGFWKEANATHLNCRL